MTAFAAIVQRDGEAPDFAGVAEAIASSAGAKPSTRTLGRCALVVAPLHRDDTAGLSVRPSGVAVAGQIVLENPRPLAAALGEPWPAGGAALVGSAYDKAQDRCTDRVSGEYAFTLWDPREQALVCARDGLGIRLLYIADTPRTVVVTNVLGAALCHPGVADDLDSAALVAFLAHGADADATRTCYRAVRVLPAGHTLVIRARGSAAPTLRRHWRFPLSDGTHRRSNEILEEYRSVLAAAVGDRLDPAGTSIFLSGGIDSTTMAAAAREVAPSSRLHAITTRYERHVEDLELPYTRAAAEHLALPLTVVDADTHAPWSTDPADPPLAAPMDEPMLADWRNALACAAQHGTASLYGEDGDVLFRPPAWGALRKSGSLPAIGLAAARYTILERRLPYLGLRLRERLGLVPRLAHDAPPWLTAQARALLDHGPTDGVLGLAPEALPPHPTRPETQRILTSTTISRVFAATIAPETTLRRVELRLPLLDTRLIRLVVSVPPIPWCQRKLLPRRAYRGRLPAIVLARPKTPLVGFNEAFVEAWRRDERGSPKVPAPLEDWVDSREWTGALQGGTASAVMEAWRVTALGAWLARRPRGVLRTACTR